MKKIYFTDEIKKSIRDGLVFFQGISELFPDLFQIIFRLFLKSFHSKEIYKTMEIKFLAFFQIISRESHSVEIVTWTVERSGHFKNDFSTLIFRKALFELIFDV